MKFIFSIIYYITPIIKMNNSQSPSESYKIPTFTPDP